MLGGSYLKFCLGDPMFIRDPVFHLESTKALEVVYSDIAIHVHL